MKVNFNNAQRAWLARAFDDAMRAENVFDAMGPTMKSMLQEAIRLYFTPFKVMDTKLPPIEVGVEEIKDDEGIVIETLYVIDLVLTMPGLDEYKEFKLPIKKKIKKSTLDYVR